MGPGIITGSSDDDPSGIVTYTQAGASFGLSTLWTAWLTLPLMISIQEMCARIGLVQRKGLAGVIKQYYSRTLLLFILLLSIPAIILNIGANLYAMGTVGNLLFPQIHPQIFSLLAIAILLWLLIRFSYKKIASILKWLCLVLLAYAIVPFLFQQDFRTIIRASVLPKLEFSREYIAILVGILGTTISPYLFFWQASVEKEEINHQKDNVNNNMISAMRSDVNAGMIFSNSIMYFIILTAATVFYPSGLHQIETVGDAALALLPLAGGQDYLLFSIGVLGTGFLSIPVLAGSISYMMAETFQWPDGLDKKFYQAKGFYLTMAVCMVAAFCISYLNISPVKALLLTAVIYGMIAPVLIVQILHICNNKVIMQEYVNDRKANLLGGICLLLMTLAAGALIFLTLAA